MYPRRHIRKQRYLKRRSRFPHIFILLLCIVSVILVLFPAAVLPPLPLFPQRSASSIRVYLHKEQQIVSLPLESYLPGVVAAEMPASFRREALRAQAVASRSYTCFKISAGGCASHPDADICTDSACCQAYQYDPSKISSAVHCAVTDTSGEVLTYDGKILNALYHACSGGYTENSEDVFSSALPYLRSVESPNEEGYPQYAAQFEFTVEELSHLLPLDKAKPLEGQFDILLGAHGRAACVTVGGISYSGTQFRHLLGLPSTCIRFDFSSDSLVISTIGYGHGVGMSQTGADAMARRGADYRRILQWYYTDCKIGSLD